MRPAELKRHRRTHTGERPFKCDVLDCPRAFSALSDLKRHTRIHSGERSFKCGVASCGKAFRQADDPNQHRRIHTQDLPYMCLVENCRPAFRTGSHTCSGPHEDPYGEGPYVCGVVCSGVKCGKGFVSSSDLGRHKRSHRTGGV